MLLDDKQSDSRHQIFGSARIKVVGVGGAGVNAVRRMGQSVPDLELLVVNTDATSLDSARGIRGILIGQQSTKGQGAGGNPEVGRQAAEESKQELIEELRGVDIVFIAAGMGGGTGTGAAPVVAAAARAAGAVSVGVVTTPFGFEGTKRKLTALKGILPLLDQIDTLILVNNQQLSSSAGRKASVQAAFAVADQVMTKAIASVSRIITTPGEVNIDLADVRSVLRNGGLGQMGIASAEGDHRVLDAARAALSNPLVDIQTNGAAGILYFITAGPDVTLAEITEAGSYIAGIADREAQIIFGLNTDPSRQPGEAVEVVIIATRLPQESLGGRSAAGRGSSGRDQLLDASSGLGSTIPLFQADATRPPLFDHDPSRDPFGFGPYRLGSADWLGPRGLS